MSSSGSSELTFNDDSRAVDLSPPAGSPAALAAQLGISDEAPPFWQQQFSKMGNVFFNSGAVALLRAWTNPPPAEAPPEAGVPQWVADEWAQRSRGQRLATRVMRDTLAFAAGCYLMDGVEAAMIQFRDGKKDQYNKVMGGVAAGGLLGFAWYPTNPQGRALVTVAGAAVGFVTWLLEERTNTVMFKMQNELERELLHKPTDQLRPELNQWYLRSLVLAKQHQVVEARRKALDAVIEQQRDLAPPPGSGGGAAAGGRGRAFGLDGGGVGAGGGRASGGYGSGDGGGDGGGAYVGDASVAAGIEAALGGPAGDVGSRRYRGAGSSGGGGGAGVVRGGSGASAGNDRGVLVISEEPDGEGGAAGSGGDSDDEKLSD